MSTVKSISVGNGDMFYIKHGNDNFTIIDCCMNEDTQEGIVAELLAESSGKGIVRFISTHPDDDHIRGLKYLHEQMNILNFYCAWNQATKPDFSEDFEQYCRLRDDTSKAFYLFRGCSRRWMNEATSERGRAGINVQWPIVDNPHYVEALAAAKRGECPNNISIIMTYSAANNAVFKWMGDMETSFMEKVEETISLGRADILFAPHHGRDTGEVCDKWVKEIQPKLIVVGEAPSEHLCYYEGYNTITQNSAGDIIFDCVENYVHIYLSNSDYSVDHLSDYYLPDAYGAHYLGSLNM